MNNIIQTIRHTARAATVLLLALLAAQTAGAQSGNWSDYKAAAFSTINESAKTIRITSEAELALLAYNTCNGTDYSGYTITLTKDLIMSAHYWDKSIGTEDTNNNGNNSFRGTFNGAGHTISGINISSGSYKGLFGFVGQSQKPGTIQNVTLASSTITGDDNVGGIVGCLLYGTVSNCHVLSSVSILASGDGSNNHGGIVGQTYPNKTNTNATIENCTSAALVTDNGHNNCSSYGGIVGYNHYYSDTYFSTVTGCFYYGTAVSASSVAGAIVGLNYKADGTGISNCYYNYPSTISGIGYGNKDIGTTRVYTVTCTTSGLSTTGTATYTHNGIKYYAAGATVTVSAPSQKIYALEATTGSISNVNIADDRHSATFTIGSGDVTLALSYSGTTSDGLTWSLSGTGFTELTIGGTGPMQAYGYTTGNIWKTKAPWGTDITSVTIGDGVTSIGNYAFIGCENVASITIGSGVTSIGIGAINHCDQMTSVTLPASVTTIAYAAFENCQKLETIYINHDGEVSLTGNHDNAFNAPLLQYIVFPSPVAALANTKETGNWARYKDNIRAQFGNQLFLATNEGGTAAYKIANEQDLRNLATAVNAGNNGSGKTFRQTLDITMSSTNFTPIGKNDNNYFSGTYDGGEKAIIGLTVNVTDNCFAGLFGCVSYGGKVKKLYLISPNANCSYSAGDSRVVGAVVGSLERNSTIEDCYVVNPKVTTPSGSGYLGVICGVSKSGENTITNCYFYDNNTSHKYKALVLSYGTITNVGRAYTIAATSPVTASATKAFTYDGTDYYVEGSTVTLSGGTPHANGGWVDTYTVNGTAIEGNTFSLTADATVAYSSTPDATHFAETGTNEYTIYDATGWDVFCELLEENNQGFFTGKTVVLDNDIAVTRMAGSTNHEFSGTFDGQKHTLTVAITGTVQGTAPFCEIKGATIRNLAVTGSVAGKRHSAGLVGFARGDNSVTNIIENCLVNTSVSITGDTNGYLGGIVGHGFTSALTIRGCAFTGSLTSTSNYTGGLQGWSDGNILTLQNDLFAPTSVSAANAGFHPVAFHNNNSTTTATVSNVYYTVAPTCTQATRIATANAAEQPKQQRNITAGENVTVSNIALTGDATEYTVSGITAYSGGGLQRGETLYYGSGDQLSLTLSNTATGAPLGYQYDSYTANAGTLSGTTLTMPDEDVTISVALAPIDWAEESTGVDADHAYMIYNKDQLLLLAHRVNGTNGETANDYSGKYFKLGADIDFTSADMAFDGGHSNYEAIGGYYNNTYCYFCGEFDGNNKTVKGIRINKNGDGRDSYADNNQGLFGMTQDASIHDVRLTDARITGFNIVGGIVGINTYGTVSNCTVTESDITATVNDSYGIIFGFSDFGTLTNNYYHGCTVNGNAVTSGAGCNRADITANNGAVPAYHLALGENITTPPGTFVGQTEWLDTPPVDARLAPENGFTLAGNHYFASGYEFTPGSTLASGAAQGYTPRATLGGQLLDPYTPTGDADPLDGKAIALLTITADCDGKTLAAALRSDGQPHDITYIKADGTARTAQAIALDGTETDLGQNNHETWYFVGLPTVAFDHTLDLNGDVNLILADGCTCTMNVTSSYNDGIDVFGILTIYGQTDGTGTLNATTSKNGNGISTDSGTINISGGRVTATGGNGIFTNSGTINISGGRVTATGFFDGIYTDSGTITLGCTTASDFIYASSYGVTPYATLKIAGDQTLYDEDGNSYSGTLSYYEDILNGKTLRPLPNVLALYDSEDNSEAISDNNGQQRNVILYGRTLSKSGEWNTLCLPFDLGDTEAPAGHSFDGTPLEGATVKELDVTGTYSGHKTGLDGTTLYLYFQDATSIKAGKPYIVKWQGASGSVSDPVFSGVTVTSNEPTAVNFTGGSFVGQYSPFSIGDTSSGTFDGDINEIIMLGTGSKLGYSKSARTLRSFRCHFYVPAEGSEPGARAFVLNFDDENTTEIISPAEIKEITEMAGAWYSLDGRKLDAKPTKKGLYIHNGNKVVIK